MADLHTLNTRIKLKYDSYENWLKNDPVLYAGEVAIATIANNDANVQGTGFTNLPNVVIKVGDGASNYSALPFVSGLAADVHGWAKMNQADFEEYLSTFISGEIQDTDTLYTIVADEEKAYTFKLMATDPEKDDNTYDNLVATIDLSDIDTRLKAVEEALGEDGSVAKKISDAIEAIGDGQPVTIGTGKAIDTITQTAGVVTVTTRDLGISDIAGLQDALDACQEDLPIDGTPSEDNKVATQATVTNAIEALDNTATYAPVDGQFVVGVKQVKGAIEVERAALKASDIPTIGQNQVEGLETALAGKQENLVFADNYNAETNPVATVATVTKAVADLEGAMHFRGKVEGDTLEAAIAASGITDWAAGDVVLWGDYEYVFDNTNWIELGNTHLYQLKADAEAQHKEITDAMDELAKAKQDVVPFEHTPSEDDKVATVKSVTDRIAENNEALAYAGGEFGDKKFAVKVTQADGVIDVEYAQPEIADISGLTEEIARVDKAIEDMGAAKQDNVAFADGYDAETNKAATVKTVSDAIGALNHEDAAVEGQFVTSVSMEGGAMTVNRAAITTDMIQQGALELVFDCGTSAV